MTNEKRLQALAELQSDGERMEKAAHEWVKDAMEADYFNPDFKLMKDAAIQDFKAGFNKALDLVMEEARKKTYKSEGDLKVDLGTVSIPDLKTIISKLRGEK